MVYHTMISPEVISRVCEISKAPAALAASAAQRSAPASGRRAAPGTIFGDPMMVCEIGQGTII